MNLNISDKKTAPIDPNNRTSLVKIIEMTENRTDELEITAPIDSNEPEMLNEIEMPQNRSDEIKIEAPIVTNELEWFINEIAMPQNRTDEVVIAAPIDSNEPARSINETEMPENRTDEVEIDDANKRVELMKEIEMMQNKIEHLRKKMNVRYTRQHVSFKDVMKKKQDGSTTVDMGPSSSKRMRFQQPLEMMFYSTFIKVHFNTDHSEMTIMVTVPGKKTYGLKFKKRENLYSLVSGCLPYSLKLHEEKPRAASLTNRQVVDYVRYVRKNIYAYHMRSEQVEEFETRIDKKIIYFSHDLACTHLEMIFPVTVKEGDWTEFRIKATFQYDLLDIRARKITVIAKDNDLRKREQRKVKKYLQSYQLRSLVELYNEVFDKEAPYSLL